MTNLYRLDAPSAAIATRFGADAGRDPWSGGDVTPACYAPVILQAGNGLRHLAPRQWGVPPPPRAGMLGGRPVLTVRNLESPFWIGTLRHRQFRCLVPVTAFRLGGARKDPVTGQRLPCWFTVAASPLFAFAGIWRDSEVPSFAILSCEANRLVGAQGVESMPVILHTEDHEAWLGEDWKRAQKLVAPFPSQHMENTVGAAPERSA